MAAVLVAVLLLTGIGTLSLSGRLAALRYMNIPFVHPYPPPGYYVNPFTGDPRDLVNAAEAEEVKQDFLRAGELEVEAFANGDASLLPMAETGRALAKARQLLVKNDANRVHEKVENQLDTVIVGRLPDPNDSSITWCVEESGRATITLVSKTTGQPLESSRIRFKSRYWLVKSSSRYLIIDAAISAEPLGTG